MASTDLRLAISARHDSGHDMDMSMSGMGVPSNTWLQRMFWAVIGSVIAFAALVNVLQKVLLWQRLASKTARPTSPFWMSVATTTAIAREIYSSSTETFHFKGLRLRSPLTGQMILLLAYFITVVVFCFYGLDTTDKWSWEDIAVRIGHIGQAQFPLIFLLAGKQNIIGFFVGTSYERLNWLHRWVARVLWVTMTMHMGFFFRSWMRWNYVIVKLKTDTTAQTGFAAWSILTVIVGLSFASIRRWNYEVFIVSHFVLFAGLIGAVMLHVNTEKTSFWVCVFLFFFDRLLRGLVVLACNLPIFRLKKGIWANKATFTSLPGNVTRVTINNPILKWKPGQHVFLSCHGLVPLQSHPFTIASLPSDGKLEFLIQARQGGTRRFHRYASKMKEHLPAADTQLQQGKYVGVEGPYGRIRSLHQFDSVVFLAGSTGASFNTPLMRELVQRWNKEPSHKEFPITRTIRYVWAIKSRDRLSWFKSQLENALADMQTISKRHNIEINLDISIYITCDEEMASINSSENISTCHPENIRGEAEYTVTQETSSVEELKKGDINAEFDEKEISSTSSEINDGCGIDGKCCCRATVEDEADNMSIAPCCCKPTKQVPTPSNERSTASLLPSELQLKILTGRPNARNIIRKVLEEAEGESAVVVCGPKGLQEDVRFSVVALSDERAVHKGTGAQGVYMHIEGFAY